MNFFSKIGRGHTVGIYEFWVIWYGMTQLPNTKEAKTAGQIIETVVQHEPQRTILKLDSNLGPSGC